MKRSWLPTQKGTDLFPNVTQKPAKLIVRGVPSGTPLHDVVLQQFGGQLKQFHSKQQHAYSLSDNPMQKGHIEWAGGRATYTNIQGQEILELEVDLSTLEELKKKQPKTPYDWAVIDLHVPIFTHTYDDGSGTLGSQTFVLARVITPKLVDDDEVPNNINPIKGEADTFTGWYYSSEDSPVLQWAGSFLEEFVANSTSTGEFVGSLLVDLRKLNMNDDVVIELYAAQNLMSSDSVFTVGDQAGYWIVQQASTPADLEDGITPGPTPATLTSTTGPQPVGFPNPYTDYADNSQIPPDYPSPSPGRGGGFEIPGLSFGDFTAGFGDYYQGGMISVAVPQGAAYFTGSAHVTIYEFHENQLHYDFYPVYYWDTPSRDVDPTTQIGWIGAAMFIGDPRWASSFVSAYDDTVFWNLWEDANAFPRRFALGRIASNVGVPLIDTEPNYEGLKFLGKLHILPKLGSVTFEPA